MRELLEELPHALLPDPARESEDPGVAREVHDDDLVRPSAEEDLPVDAHRSKRSPLARHIDVVVDPFDPRLPTPLGLTLAVEGQRVRSAQMTAGFVHQGIERRAVGLAVDDVELAALLSPVAPGHVAQLAVARAVERLAGHTPDGATGAWRDLVMDLVAVAEHCRVLLDVVRRSPRQAPALALAASAAGAALEGIDVGHRLGHPFRLRTPVPDDERLTLRRRTDDVARALKTIDDDRVLAAVAHLRGAGILDVNRCRELGIDGPALLAAGGLPTVAVDLGQEHTAFHPVGQPTGCTVARVEIRLQLLRGAALRLPQHLERLGTIANLDRLLGDGPHPHVAAAPTFTPTASLSGTADALVAGPGGTTSCLVDLVEGRVNRLRIRPPELPMVLGVSRALLGVRLDDVSEVIASFGMQASALDR